VVSYHEWACDASPLEENRRMDDATCNYSNSSSFPFTSVQIHLTYTQERAIEDHRGGASNSKASGP